MENRGAELLGRAPAKGERFPWLCKILDARQDLSLQVHPPARLAAKLGGEPKTEMWYVADANPGAFLYVGLRPGVTKEQFAARSRDGSVAKCFHRHTIQPGDAMFLPVDGSTPSEAARSSSRSSKTPTLPTGSSTGIARARTASPANSTSSNPSPRSTSRISNPT